jgi:hypothetical protein
MLCQEAESREFPIPENYVCLIMTTVVSVSFRLQDGPFAEWSWGGNASPKDMQSSLPCNCAGRLTGQAAPLDLAILKMEKNRR